MKFSELQAGDIIIQGTGWNGTFVGAHTLMCVGDNKVVDADPTGVFIGDYVDDDSRRAVGFRLSANAGLATGAAAEAAYYAKNWAVPRFSDQGQLNIPGTAYSMHRASAINLYYKERLGITSVPPFEFDALYRALKWASRNDEGTALSRNRGITCAAFVVACFQAGVLLRLSFHNQMRIAKVYEKLLGLRVDKKDLTNKLQRHAKIPYTGQSERLKGTMLENYYRYEVSNVGLRDLDCGVTVSGQIRLMLEEFFEERGYAVKAQIVEGMTGAHLFTRALGYDAKFYQSRFLYQNLIEDPMWTNLNEITAA